MSILQLFPRLRIILNVIFKVELIIFYLYIDQVPAVTKTSVITQDSGVITAKAGGNVTLSCFCRDAHVTFLSWYQQTLGGKPQIILTMMAGTAKTEIHHKSKDKFHVFVENAKGTHFNLTITNLHLSDSATYYCGINVFDVIEFGKGAFLHVRRSLSKIHPVIHQPVSERIHPGESLSLSCTVNAEPCAEGHSFYWLIHGGSESGIIPQHTPQCEELSSAESPMQNCTFNLLMETVTPTDAGTYYCAMASCGEVVLGNGTTVDIVGM